MGPSPAAAPEQRGAVWGAVAVATTGTIFGILPAFLVGTLAVQIRDEMGFGEARLGALITAYLFVSGTLSTPAGRLVERLGAASGLRIAAASGAISMGGIALAADTYTGLAGFLLVGGLGHAAVSPAANLAVARRVPARLQGAAFGIKQAAIPAASFLGGMAVPIASAGAGWRLAFLAGAAASLVIFAVAGRASTHRLSVVHHDAGPLPVRPLVLLAVGVALAMGGVQPLATFYVSYTTELAMAPSVAGGLLAGASLVNIVVRIASGALAGKQHVGRLLAVCSAFIVVGASGITLVAAGTPRLALVVGVFVGVGIGWSWNGMFQFAVVKTHPAAPAAASSITQTGVLLGTAVGPLLFGLAVEWASYRAAWLGTAACMVVGAVLVGLAGRSFTNIGHSPGAPGHPCGGIRR